MSSGQSYGGDHIQQYGSGSIGKATHSGSGNIVGGSGSSPESRTQMIDNLLREVQVLRDHLVDENDRAEIDEAAAQINTAPDEQKFKRLLRTIAGIAATVGEVGAPVVALSALLGSP